MKDPDSKDKLSDDPVIWAFLAIIVLLSGVIWVYLALQAFYG